METSSATEAYAPPQADLGIRTGSRPRLRLWLTIASWLFVGPIVAFLSANVNLPAQVWWSGLLAAWVASVGWVVSGYRHALGKAFTSSHAVMVGLGTSVGIALLASCGVALLLAAFGGLPGVSLGS
jgi:hypothetical protein